MLSWYHKIDDAVSIADVLSGARDYVATWSPEDLARLPKASRPGPLKTPADLDRLHGALVEEYRTSRATGEDLAALQRITSFMVRAAVRLAQLQGDDAPGPGDEPPAAPHRRNGAPRDRN